jgi:ParB/RepB/Spo0J family partition protein
MSNATASYEELWKENPLQLVEIPCEDIIIVQELSGRSEYKRDVKSVKELTASIQEMGQIEPAVVGLNTDAQYGAIGAPILYVGFGRHEACTAAKVDLLCMYSPKPVSEVLVFGMHENMKREPLSPIQFATNIKRLNDAGMKDNEIAKKLGCSPGNISMHKKFLATEEGGTPLFSAKALRAIHEKKISARIAYMIADLGSAAKIEKAIDKAIEDGKGTTSGVKASAVKQVREHNAEEAPKARKKGKRGKMMERSYPEVKKFLPPAVRTTVKTLLDYIEGKKDEKNVETVLMKLAA